LNAGISSAGRWRRSLRNKAGRGCVVPSLPLFYYFDSRESGNPGYIEVLLWTPAFAGVTV
jgi:hypothetical protein